MRGDDWAGGMGGGERAKSTFWVGRGVEGGRGERKKGIMHLSKMDVIVIVCSVLVFDVMCSLRAKSLSTMIRFCLITQSYRNVNSL